MKKLKKRDKRAIGLAVGFVAIYLLVFHLILPFYESQAGVESGFDTTEGRLQRAVKTIKQREVYAARLDEINKAVEQYQSRLLSSTDSVAAGAELEEIVRAAAVENKVTLTKTNPLPEKKVGEKYAKVTLQITLDGDLTATTGFLHALSAHPKFLIVEDFAVSKFREMALVQPRLSVSGYIRLS